MKNLDITKEDMIEGWLDPYFSDEDLQKISEDKKGLWTTIARETAEEVLKIRKEFMEKR